MDLEGNISGRYNQSPDNGVAYGTFEFSAYGDEGGDFLTDDLIAMAF